MRKLMLLAAMLAMVLAVAAPAFAQNQTQTQDQDATSGDVTNEGSGGFSVTGDSNSFEDVNVAQCTAALNQVNTGNQQSQQAINQYGYSQYATQDSTQVIFQDASVQQACEQAVGDVTTVAPAPAPVAAAGAAAAPAAAPAAAAAAPAAAAAAPAPALPATGGISLLALGAGALLVGGGLVVRRFVR